MTLVEDARDGSVKITEEMALPIIRDMLIAVNKLHKGGILVRSCCIRGNCVAVSLFSLTVFLSPASRSEAR